MRSHRTACAHTHLCDRVSFEDLQQERTGINRDSSAAAVCSLTIEYDLLIAKQIDERIKHFLFLFDLDIMCLQGGHYLIARFLWMQTVALVFGG